MKSKKSEKNGKKRSKIITEFKKLRFTKDRIALRDALKKRSNLLHDMYIGAIKTYNVKSIPNRLNLSAHSIREIMHKLPGELIIDAERDGKHLKALSIELKQAWKKTIVKNYYQSESDINFNQFDTSQVVSFLKNTNRFFEESESILAIKEELSLAIIKHLQKSSGLGNLSESNKAKQVLCWKQSWDYFVKTAHHNNEKSNQFLDKLHKFEQLILNLLCPSTFKKFSKIKALIKRAGKSVTKQLVDDALELISNDEEEKYFYKNITSSWLEPLKEKGIFKATPTVVRNNKGGIAICPDWPPTYFLKNIAKEKPDQVIDILLELPAIKNSRVCEDLMPVIILLPSDKLERLKNIIMKWFNNEGHFRLFGQISELNSKLLSNGYDDVGLLICGRMFEIIDSNYINRKSGTYAINEWEYNQAIQKISKSINSTDSKIRFIKILCYKLRKAIEAELSKPLRIDCSEDLSHTWRRSIQKNNHDGGDDIRDILISQIIKISKDVVSQNSKLLTQIIEMLFSFQYAAFCRIALFLINSYEKNKNVIYQSLMNINLAVSDDAFHEYVAALKNISSKLSKNETGKLFDFYMELNFGNGTDRYNNYRRYRMLYFIRDYLSREKLKLYNKLFSSYEINGQPEYLFYDVIAREVKPIYSISSDELKQLPIADAAKRIHDWQSPADEQYGEYTQGVSLAIESLISSKADEVATNFHLFKFENSSFARAVVNGYSKILEGESNIHWTDVLNYCQWIVEHPSPLPSPGQDTDWGWRGAKDAVFWMIERGFNSKKLSIDFREKVWTVISTGLQNLSTHESYHEDDEKNYHHDAINDSKGVAFNLAIRYGVWVIASLEIKPIDSSKTLYPELFDTLDFYVDFNNSKSKKIHALFGSWLYWLYMLDSEWVKENLHLLFPSKPEHKNFLNAIWNSYLLYGNVSVDILGITQEQYLRSIEELLDTKVGNYDLTDRIVGHLSSLYLAGAIPLDSELVQCLYKNSTNAIRADIINTIGRMMNQKSLDAAQEFWKFRVNACDKMRDWSELVEFGQWVRSGILPTEWMLDQTIFVLEKASNIDPAYMVVEKIGKYASLYPDKVVKIISAIVNNRINDHGMFMWDKYLHPIIPILLNSDVKNEAKEIVHKLGALGLTEFGRYLSKQ